MSYPRKPQPNIGPHTDIYIYIYIHSHQVPQGSWQRWASQRCVRHLPVTHYQRLQDIIHQLNLGEGPGSSLRKARDTSLETTHHYRTHGWRCASSYFLVVWVLCFWFWLQSVSSLGCYKIACLCALLSGLAWKELEVFHGEPQCYWEDGQVQRGALKEESEDLWQDLHFQLVGRWAQAGGGTEDRRGEAIGEWWWSRAIPIDQLGSHPVWRQKEHQTRYKED